MSATEIPILDPKNIIVRSPPPSLGLDQSRRLKRIYDPVAKLSLYSTAVGRPSLYTS